MAEGMERSIRTERDVKAERVGWIKVELVSWWPYT